MIRWKTNLASDGLGARVYAGYEGGGGEYILGETTPEFSTTWKVTTGTLSATGQTKNIITLAIYADDYPNDCPNTTYYVYYDFILFYTDTFTFPYLSNPLDLDIVNREAVLKPLKRVGNITQYLGMDSPLIVLSGDMDDNAEWGDPLGFWLMEVTFARDNNPWQWFTSDLASFKVEVVSLKIKQTSEEGAKRQWVLTLRKHDEFDGSGEWIGDYFNL